MRNEFISIKILILSVYFFSCSPQTVYNDITKTEEKIINEPKLYASVKGGCYYETISVDLTCDYSDAKNAGLKIYYNLSDATPDLISDLYTGSINITRNSTLSFIAYLDKTPITKVKRERFKILIKPIEVSPLSGEFTADKMVVSLQSKTEGTTIIYTTDGSNPSRENGFIYSEAVEISYFTILKFFAYKEGFEDTAISRYAYSFKVLPPEINPFVEGTDIEIYNDALIKIGCQTPSANIYYTLDGSIPSSNSYLYDGSIILTPDKEKETVTLKTVAYKYGFAYSELKEQKYIFKVASVGVYPQGGIYENPLSVVLTSSLNGSKIYYTTDGSEPTNNSTLYETPIEINDTTTIKAIAIKEGFTNSDVLTALYSFKVKTPFFSKPSGLYSENPEISINCLTTDATIRYVKTIDENENPDENSTIFEGAKITVEEPYFVKAIAYKNGLSASDVAVFKMSRNINYVKADTPVFSIAEGNYDTVQSVKISTSTGGSKIFYTIDGTTPDFEKSAYFDDSEGTLDIFNSQTVKCIAYKDGMECSEIAEAVYKIASYKLESPKISVKSGEYYEPKVVEITHPDPLTSIRYTLDGSDPTETSNSYYGNPLVISGVSSEITLKTKAFKSGYSSSDSISESYVFTLPEVSFNPVGGEYSNSIGLYLSQPVTGAVIRYALNGDIPTETTGTIFTGSPVSVANGTIVKAIAYKSGWKTSQVKSQTYALKLNKPIFITDSSKVYKSSVRVQIEIVPKSAKIKYTVDGSDPKTSSSAKAYSSVIEISSETTIKCYALKEGWNDSDVEEKTYKFQ